MSHGYTIRIYVPEGDPEGLRIIENMNWTGKGIAFPRNKWSSTHKHADIDRPGVYILWGDSLSPETPLPTIYVGESDSVSGRIEQHLKNETKDWWSHAIVFTSDNLNKAYIRYIESALLARAKKYKRCVLDNNTEPTKPFMTASDCADAEAFLDQILKILPLVDVNVFDEPKAHLINKSEVINAAAILAEPNAPTSTSNNHGNDLVIVVPCREEGFNKVFLGEHCWYYVRIAPGKAAHIKWCAGYQGAPISAVTHIAPVKSLEFLDERGEYKIVFAKPAIKLENPIIFGQAKQGNMQGPRYTTLAQFKSAKEINELTINWDTFNPA
jgi:hypothetical protein